MNKIYICTHKDFDCPVSNEVYEVVNVHDMRMPKNGLRDSFYSEILTHKRMAERRRRKDDIIGFCGYRNYFDFMDNVPDLNEIIEKHGCITTEPVVFPGGNLRTQYASCLNVEDLDIVTGIIYSHFPDFFPAWDRAKRGSSLHIGNLYIMKASDAKKMMQTVWGVLEHFVDIVGDVDERIRNNPKKYMHLPESAMHEYQYRMGGHLGERMTSAWIDWYFPDAYLTKIFSTGDAVR